MEYRRKALKNDFLATRWQIETIYHSEESTDFFLKNSLEAISFKVFYMVLMKNHALYEQNQGKQFSARLM